MQNLKFFFIQKFSRLCLMAFCLVSFYSTNAQAIVGDSKLIQLEESVDLKYSNAIEFESKQFSDVQSLKAMKMIYDTPLSTLMYDSKLDHFTIQLELRAKPEWTKEDWNDYLKSLITK